jgi:hypothetical protein
MAAGLGFKTFNTGDVLTAGDTNGYLMQGVLVFANAAARDAAITSPQEGQFAYLKDTDATTYYTGSAWTSIGGGGGGKVLQVVQASTTTEKFISSTSYVDTNLTGTITPTSATSKILVMIVQSGQIFRAISGLNAAIQLLRGATVVWTPSGTTAHMQYEGTGTTNFSLCTYMPLTYLDSPATTSATTYKTQGKVSTAANSAVFTVQTGSNPSQMILMEIGA